MTQESMAVPVLDRGGAADRLRNHLRRRAITRLGLIEGDLYMIPFWRAAGRGPAGEERFYLLAAEVGDSRLRRPNLLPADLKPLDPAALPAGAVLVKAETTPEPALARAAALGWRADRLEERIHYPFWMMRVEDSGRIEGAWIDGIEGRLILHSLKVPPPLPSVRESALALAAPALSLAALRLLVSDPIVMVAGSAAIAAVSGVVIHQWLSSRARREGRG